MARSSKRKARREERRQQRYKKKQQKYDFRLAKKREKTEFRKAKWDAKKDIAQSKWESKTAQSEAESEADMTAYENGIAPVNRRGRGWESFDNVVDNIGGILGNNNSMTDVVEDYIPNEFNEPEAASGNSKMYLIFAAVGLILMKFFKR